MTAMNTTDIQTLINALPARMADKGLRQPEVSFRLVANERPVAVLCWLKGTETYNYAYQHCNADTPQGALDAAVKFIAELPSAEETKRNTFIAALAKVVDLGNELGQDVGVLASEMKRMSENIITDQRDQRRAA